MLGWIYHKLLEEYRTPMVYLNDITSVIIDNRKSEWRSIRD